MDIYDLPVAFNFDLVNGSSPLIIGLDIKQHAARLLGKVPEHSHSGNRTTYTCTRYTRMLLNTVAGTKDLCTDRTIQNLNSEHTNFRDDWTQVTEYAKKIHRFGHANAIDMKFLMNPTGLNEYQIRKSFEEVQEACAICAASGQPNNIKIYLPPKLTILLTNKSKLIICMQQYTAKIMKSSI